MNFVKKNLVSIILLLMLIGVIIFGIFKSNTFNKQVTDLKKTILSKDSIQKVRDGEYTKLIDDTKTQAELNKEVNTIAKETYKDIKKSGEKIVSNTNISVKPVTKIVIDTVYVDSSGTQKFTSYYPNIDSAFITHKITIQNSLATNSWEFKPLKINVVVTQQKDGMYRARLIGPKWIEAEEVTINGLPMTSVTERKFKYLLGASGGYSFQNNDLVVEVYTGFKYKSQIILLHGETNKVVSIGYIKEF